MLDGPNGSALAGDAGAAPVIDGTGAAGAADDPNAKIIEDYRKRQAGAEKARQEAERLLREAQAELAAARANKPAPKPSDGGPDIEARLAEMQAAFDKRLSEQVAKVTGDALNARFPAARAKFPEVLDPVKLAELETVFGEQPAAAPTPLGNNPQRGATGAKNIEDMTTAELKAAIKALPRSAMGLSD